MDPEGLPVQLPRVGGEGVSIERAPDIKDVKQPGKTEYLDENREVLHDHPAISSVAASQAADDAVKAQYASSAADDTNSSSSIADDNLGIATDDGLIEKEWVSKAKSIVSDTKGDPYKQEDEVSKLQADYLKKRYGSSLDINISGLNKNK